MFKAIISLRRISNHLLRGLLNYVINPIAAFKSDIHHVAFNWGIGSSSVDPHLFNLPKIYTLFAFPRFLRKLISKGHFHRSWVRGRYRSLKIFNEFCMHT